MNPTLCEIETNDPDNPAFIDPADVGQVVHRGGAHGCPTGTYTYPPGEVVERFLTSKLTTRQVVEALEAAGGYSERETVLIDGLRRIQERDFPGATSPRLYAGMVLERAGAAERTELEKTLLAGLELMAKGDIANMSRQTYAQQLLRCAGVPDAEPRQLTT